MWHRWIARLFHSRVRSGSGQSHGPRPGRRLSCELLEARELLSVASPTFVLAPPLQGVAPMAGSGPAGYTPAQIKHAYGFDQINFNGTAGNGSGTTIAIVDAYDDPSIASDLHQFDLQFGLPDPTLTKVNQTGGTTMPAGNTGWADEIALDVEWAHAIAPAAKILLVEANSSSFSDLLTAVKYAASQPGVVAVSMSWGGGEFSGETSYDSYFQTPAGHTGVVFVASSGDSGAPASYPAISPNVLSVGGTTLNLSAGNYGSESAWSGSGGGISAYETQPAYQKGVVTQSITYRTNPDVAYDANPNTGFPVYDSYGNANPWLEFGGTSDAAPQWAALVAVADQGRALAGKAALNGSGLLSSLYQLPANDFHDITTGYSTGSPIEYAGSGYDLATGRGTPVANLVVAGLGAVIGSNTTATHFRVTAAPTSTAAGLTISITVTALDANNNVVPGYVDTVHFSSSDNSATLPADYTFTSSDQGNHTFNIVLRLAGTQTVTVTDLATSSIQGSASFAVTPAAVAGFRVRGFLSPIAAGTASSFTVQAVDAYGNATSTYSGTVHFTSSDPSAVLPPNAILSSGAGTFSGTLFKAGSESITATDTANAALSGRESGIVVNPSTPTHLFFVQQPTNASVGTAITPAVTVELLDAYNNVVTTDNTDSVSLALGANPTGATLGGTTTVTVVRGVAAFNNVSLNKVGAGYTLVAAAGSLPHVTSTSFAVSAATTTVIENFENGLGNYWYVGYDYPSFYTTTAAAHNGSYGLDIVGNSDWIFRDDAAAQVKAGDTISVWVQLSSIADGRAYFGFGASANGTLSLVVAPNTGQLILQDNTGFGFSQISAVSQQYQANHWYRLEVDWGTSGTIIGKLYDSNGTTLLNTLSGVDNSITAGGIAFRGTYDDKYFDTVTVTPAVNNFLASPAPSANPIVGRSWFLFGSFPASGAFAVPSQNIYSQLAPTIFTESHAPGQASGTFELWGQQGLFMPVSAKGHAPALAGAEQLPMAGAWFSDVGLVDQLFAWWAE